MCSAISKFINTPENDRKCYFSHLYSEPEDYAQYRLHPSFMYLTSFFQVFKEYVILKCIRIKITGNLKKKSRQQTNRNFSNFTCSFQSITWNFVLGFLVSRFLFYFEHKSYVRLVNLLTLLRRVQAMMLNI